MPAVILNHPAKAAEQVCHEEQMTIWVEEIVGRLSMGGWLREDLSYDDGIDLGRAMADEIRSIVEMAFTHPEALKPLSK